MFQQEMLDRVDPNYFNVILLDGYDVSIQSKNTGHYWSIHSTEWPSENACVVYHKHCFRHPYHLHARASSLGKALRDIRKHDEWQMNGRKAVQKR